MLEKIGLPPKPSMRGSSWVLDASHCQGCSSQFTFINRKHHCRRCGGIFCGSCTNQRMVLRGQGDSPVRICDPCKKLEEAARFELRHGHKIRSSSSRGGSKMTTNPEDEVLNQILGTNVKKPSTISNTLSDFEESSSNVSSSSFNEESISSPINSQKDTEEDLESYSPEDLRQQSLEEKKKYKILKGEGKPEEALKAFKRGKELERQAKALELTIKKNSKRVLSSNSLAGKTIDASEGSFTKSKSTHIKKEETKDLASELRELGWSDADLHDADKKPAKTSLESELSTLVGEVHKKSGTSKGTGTIDKTEVIALKKKALILKREGKLAEAKEELKKAKILEKQLEEQELLAGSEDSDDELSALIHSMEDDKQVDFSLLDGQDAGFDFGNLDVTSDLAFDTNFEVTKEDMEDPEIAAALETLGWTEDSEQPVVTAAQPVPIDGISLSNDILALKKEALRQKQSGNLDEAMTLLRKAKLLERDAENNFGVPSVAAEKVFTSQTAGSVSSRKVDDGRAATSIHVEPRYQAKNKMMIQRELLALKKKALALRREGKMDESEEELRKGKVLESQLEEMESGPSFKATKVNASSKVSEPVHVQPDTSGVVGLEEEDDDVGVTERDMQDPAMLKMLETLGWKDEDRLPKNNQSRNSDLDNHHEDSANVVVQSTIMMPKRSKAELQRELLGLKRKALTLRRQGEIEEAEEVLKKAKLLEAQMEEIDAPNKEPSYSVTKTQESLESQTAKPAQVRVSEDLPRQNVHDPPIIASVSTLEMSQPVENTTSLLGIAPPTEINTVEHTGPFPQQDHSVNLVDLLTGSGWQSSQVPAGVVESKGGSSIDTVPLDGLYVQSRPVKSNDQEKSFDSVQETLVNETDSTLHNSQNTPTDLRQEILARKRKALALKREGKLTEAREELRQAKLMEKSLQEVEPELDSSSSDATISTSSDAPVVERKSPQQAPKPMTGRERFKLQQESLSHKRQALKLRREGRNAEADAELELAKALEAQLEESSGPKSSKESEGTNDLGVEDLLDPQLLSALRAIGLQDVEIASQAPIRPEASKESVGKVDASAIEEEKSQLQELIRAEKVKAVNLKRAGKQGEALDALRRAKLHEKKLKSFA